MSLTFEDTEFGENNNSSVKYEYGDKEEEMTCHDRVGEEDSELNCDIVGDVVNNLSVLSQLFPAIKCEAATLRSSCCDTNEIEQDKSHVQAMGDQQQATKPGLSFAMQRYDPSSAISSKKYEVKPFETITNKINLNESASKLDTIKENKYNRFSADKRNSEDNNEGDSIHSYNGNEDKTPIYGDDVSSNKQKCPEKVMAIPTEKTTSQLYEQQKLEAIFKEHNKPEYSSGSKFTFSFDQAESPCIVNKPSHTSVNASNSSGGTFSFSFNLPEDNSKAETKVTQLPNTSCFGTLVGDKVTEHDNNQLKESDSTPLIAQESRSSTSYIIQRQGAMFAQSDLEKWENEFFSLNEGYKIKSQEEIDKDKELWHQERRALTLDWKWKHSRAVAHRNKKWKHNR